MAAPAASSGHVVANLSRTSAVVGAVDVEVSQSAADVTVEHCADCTVFVTAAVRSLTLRGLTRCTVIAAPSTASVTLAGCVDCVVSAAAPSVVASDVVGSLLFVASRTPVSVAGASRDVRMGPYNVVGDGLLGNSGMLDWTTGKGGSGSGSSSGSGSGSGSSAGDTFCRLDSAAAACVRAITPADFFWRFLPVPQLRQERLPLPAAYATPDLPPDLARLDTRDSLRSQRIEQLTQMKFVVRVRALGGHGHLLCKPTAIPCSCFTHAPTRNTTHTHTPGVDAPRQQSGGAQKRFSQPLTEALLRTTRGEGGEICGRG